MVAAGSSEMDECFCQITCHITDDSHLRSLPEEPELSHTESYKLRFSALSMSFRNCPVWQNFYTPNARCEMF